MTAPAFYNFLPGGYVDVTLHLLLMAVFYFALRAIHGRQPGRSVFFAVACGVTAMTVKVTVLASIAIACVFIALALYFARES